jgi:hypothetical protein
VSTPASMTNEPDAPAVVFGNPPALEAREEAGLGEEEKARVGTGNAGSCAVASCWVSILIVGSLGRTLGPRLRSAGRMVVGGAARRIGRLEDWSTVIHEVLSVDAEG